MDKKNIDNSPYPSSESLQDHTITITPLPQAASTAVKSSNNNSTLHETKESKGNSIQSLQSSCLIGKKQFHSDFEKKLYKDFNHGQKYMSKYTKLILSQPEKATREYSHLPEDFSKSTSNLSSIDSSFGLLSPITLLDAQEKPLAGYSEKDKFELSQRLEKELQDDSCSNDAQEKQLAEYNEQDKFELSQRLEKELQLDSCSFVKFEEAVKDNVIHHPNLKYTNTNEMTVWNTSNSNFSIDSVMFQSEDNVAERLQRDEDEWRGSLDRESVRSLSGIYEDGELATGAHGEKLSISSFLRSGSGPLGSLDSVTNIINNQRPHFGLLVSSPEKKFNKQPIRPPPKDKLTFIINEESLSSKHSGDGRDNPWNHQSLIKQYSMVHGSGSSDVSVPSISYIGNLLSENEGNLNPREIFDKLTASARNPLSHICGSKDVHPNNPEDAVDSVWQQDKLHQIPLTTLEEDSFCRGFHFDHLSRRNVKNESYNPQYKEDHKITERCENAIIKDISESNSICDITSFDGVEDEYICVLTPVSMDFEIVNNCTTTMCYFITKACFLNNTREDSAAVIHVPVNNLTLEPNEKKVVPVFAIPFVEGTVKIKLEVTRKNTVTQEVETNNVFGKIVAELPKISMKTPASLNMKLVDNFCDESIEVKNYGLSPVPLTLKISQINFDNVNIFYFNEGNCKTISVSIKPGQTYKQRICCQAPYIYEVAQRAGIKITLLAQVDILLDTPSKNDLPPLLTVPIQSQMEIVKSRDIKLLGTTQSSCLLYNSSNQLVNIEVSTTAGYNVQTPLLTIPPLQTTHLLISYSGNPFKKGTLTLQDLEHNTLYTMNLYPFTYCSSSNSSLVTPQSSRATSPLFPINFGIYGDELKVTCTHKELVWGGCPLQQRVVRTCILKNEGSHREKLRLTITDSHNCFKILNDKHKLENEIKLSLQPMQSCQISVALLAATNGPKWGQLTISRINAHLDKKVIPLYGFGGKAKITIEGILQDPEQHMWLYLDSDSLSSTFTLLNVGDFAAFIKITDGMSATSVGGGLSIAPPEGILVSGTSMVIEICLSVTADRLEYLLAKPSQSSICITRLAVIHGDESTRLRLTRLSAVDHLVANKLSTLSHHLPVSTIPQIEKLNDPIGCGETLWLDDVTEWTIGVLVSRSSLEAMRLDTSCDFVELSNTVSPEV